MTFSDFLLDAFFQSLILADIGLAISLILRRQKTTVAFFASKIVFSSSLGISTFVFVTVLGLGVRYPALMRPLSTPLSFLFLWEGIPVVTRATTVVALALLLFAPVVFYFWKLAQAKDAEQELREDFRLKARDANRYAARNAQKLKALKSELSRYEDAYAFIVGSHEVSEQVRQEFIKIVRHGGRGLGKSSKGQTNNIK